MSKIVDNSVKFIVGERALENLPYEIKLAGCSKPMLVCDDMSYRLGLKKSVLKAFDGSGMDIEFIDQKVGDVATCDDVERIIKEYNSSNCDCMILLGKKSVVSVGKASKIMIKDGSFVVAQYDGKTLSDLPVKEVPLFIITAYFGSGIECSGKVRIYSKDQKTIYEFDSIYAQTDGVIIDERMTDIMPPKAIASYGLFALAMAVDGYIKSDERIYTKPYSMTAIEILSKNLMKGILHNADKRARKELHTAVVVAGCGYFLIEKQLLAVMSDVISDRYKVNHANIMAILFRHYIKMTKFNKDMLAELLPSFVSMEEYAQTSEEHAGEAVLHKIGSLYEQVGEYVDYNKSLKDFGIEKSDFPSIAEEVIASVDAKDRTDEYSYSFLINLLEESY